MKKITLLFLVSLLSFMTTNIQAEEWGDQESCCNESDYNPEKINFYAKILTGPNFLQNTAIDGNKSTYQTGYTVGVSLGYNWRYGLHLEGEYAYRRNAIKKIHFGEESSNHGHFQTSSYMANLFWDLSFWRYSFFDIQPFIGAGIGYDSQQMHSSNSRIIFSQKWKHFSWQVMAGLTSQIFCNIEMTLEYKFHQGGCHFYNHSVGVGFIYQFDF